MVAPIQFPRIQGPSQTREQQGGWRNDPAGIYKKTDLFAQSYLFTKDMVGR
jgi:hypothetical protein